MEKLPFVLFERLVPLRIGVGARPIEGNIRRDRGGAPSVGVFVGAVFRENICQYRLVEGCNGGEGDKLWKGDDGSRDDGQQPSSKKRLGRHAAVKSNRARGVDSARGKKILPRSSAAYRYFAKQPTHQKSSFKNRCTIISINRGRLQTIAEDISSISRLKDLFIIFVLPYFLIRNRNNRYTRYPAPSIIDDEVHRASQTHPSVIVGTAAGGGSAQHHTNLGILHADYQPPLIWFDEEFYYYC